MKQLGIKKATQESDMPTKIMKQFPNLFVDFLRKNINSCLTEDIFHNDFKKAVVHSAQIKECKIQKSNYRPISILPNLSKISNKAQCGFCKGYNAQHCLLA